MTAPADDISLQLIGKIPVENLWLMYLYASRRLQHPKVMEKLAAETAPDKLPNLLATLLCHQVELRLKTNLNQVYEARYDVLSRVRGRIDIVETQKRRLVSRGKVVCSFDELTVNSSRNAFIRGALEKIASLVKTDAELKKRCLSLSLTMQRLGVTDVTTDARLGGIRPLGQNEKDDVAVVAIAELVMTLSLLSERQGKHLLPRPFRNDEAGIRLLYEYAVYGFYRHHLSGEWTVKHNGPLYWAVDDASEGLADILPRMEYDILLTRKGDNKKIVIDTKFTSVLRPSRFEKKTLKSEYIYQMYAYLRSQEELDPSFKGATGLFLHPEVDQEVFEYVVIQGHPIVFATINLCQDSNQVKKDLMNLENRVVKKFI